MSDWHYHKLSEVERRLDKASGDLTPRQQKRLAGELAEIKKEIGWGKGAYLLGAPDDLMRAGTWTVDERLRQMERQLRDDDGITTNYQHQLPATPAEERQAAWFHLVLLVGPLLCYFIWFLS